MFSYGRGRAQQTLIAGSGSIIGFIPLLFLIYVALLPFIWSIRLYFIPLCIYVALDICFTVATIGSSGSILAGLLFFLFPLMHISNGYGLLFGLIRGKNGVSSTNGNQAISVRRLKEFGQCDW
jgi:hypothetical protein